LTKTRDKFGNIVVPLKRRRERKKRKGKKKELEEKRKGEKRREQNRREGNEREKENKAQVPLIRKTYPCLLIC